jgi:hypothetical protein
VRCANRVERRNRLGSLVTRRVEKELVEAAIVDLGL